MPNPVYIDAGRREILGSVIESWYEWDIESGECSQYVTVESREGMIERAYCGGNYYAIDLDDGSLYLTDTVDQWERTSRSPHARAGTL